MYQKLVATYILCVIKPLLLIRITQIHHEPYRIPTQQMCRFVTIQHLSSYRLRFTQRMFTLKQAYLRFWCVPSIHSPIVNTHILCPGVRT